MPMFIPLRTTGHWHDVNTANTTFNDVDHPCAGMIWNHRQRGHWLCGDSLSNHRRRRVMIACVHAGKSNQDFHIFGLRCEAVDQVCCFHSLVRYKFVLAAAVLVENVTHPRPHAEKLRLHWLLCTACFPSKCCNTRVAHHKGAVQTPPRCTRQARHRPSLSYLRYGYCKAI